MIFGVLNPAYLSFKAVKTKNVKVTLLSAEYDDTGDDDGWCRSTCTG